MSHPTVRWQSTVRQVFISQFLWCIQICLCGTGTKQNVGAGCLRWLCGCHWARCLGNLAEREMHLLNRWYENTWAVGVQYSSQVKLFEIHNYCSMSEIIILSIDRFVWFYKLAFREPTVFDLRETTHYELGSWQVTLENRGPYRWVIPNRQRYSFGKFGFSMSQFPDSLRHAVSDAWCKVCLFVTSEVPGGEGHVVDPNSTCEARVQGVVAELMGFK